MKIPIPLLLLITFQAQLQSITCQSQDPSQSQSQPSSSWKNIGTIYGSHYKDYSGSNIELSSTGKSLLIHSALNGSWFQGKTIFYNYNSTSTINNKDTDTDTDESTSTLNNWQPVHQIEYNLHSAANSHTIGMAYAGDGTRMVLALHPSRIFIYDLDPLTNRWVLTGNETLLRHANGSRNVQNEDEDEDDDEIFHEIDLSYDGSILAVSSYNFGIGSTRIYRQQNSHSNSNQNNNSTNGNANADGAWEIMGSPIPSMSNNDPDVVSLSDSGKRVAISSRFVRSSDSSNHEDKDEVQSQTDSNLHGHGHGHTRVYEFDEGSMEWDPIGTPQHFGGMEGDWSGKAMALSGDGNTVAIGAPYHDGIPRTSTGTGMLWNASTDGEGIAIAESEDGAGAGAGKKILQNIGSVRMYRYNETKRTWTPLGQPLVGRTAYESFGNSLAISYDGNIVAVGMSEIFQADQYVSVYQYQYSYQNDDSGTGTGGNSWVPLGDEIWSDRHIQNFFGTALSLSSNGKILAIGSPGASGSHPTERNIGLTAIYEFAEQAEPDPVPQVTLPPIIVNSRRDTNLALGRRGGSLGWSVPVLGWSVSTVIMGIAAFLL